MRPLELIWDGELDSGSRAETLVSLLQSREPPPGVSVFLDDSAGCRVDVSTRSVWAFATWAVSVGMIWFGLTSNNWFLVVLAPFMVGAAIMQSLGSTCIVFRDEQVRVFEGVAGIGTRRKMALRAIRRVEYAAKHGRGGSTAWIVLQDERRSVKFGRHLNDEQTRFVIALLLDAVQSLAS